MRPHNQGHLDWVRGIAERQRAGESEQVFELDGLTVRYTTIHLRDDQKPFDFAVAAAVLPRVEGGELEYAIAVSDDVPEELRGLWAWHELNDFGRVGHETQDRCLTSEKRLVNLLGSRSELYNEYLIHRIPFYVGLIKYIDSEIARMGDDTPYSLKDLMGASDTVIFLQSIEAANAGFTNEELL